MRTRPAPKLDLDPATLRWLADDHDAQARWFFTNAKRLDWRGRLASGTVVDKLESGEAARVALAHRRQAARLRNLAARAERRRKEVK